ncbi:MAG: 3-keto-5-aminohexanoate cleavage protein [Jatrophihabitantaceae bacterium]
MLLQAALNGAFTKSRHPAIPLTAAELTADALACRQAGAGAFHLHPRDADGIERMAASVVDEVVRTVRHGLGCPVGVTTGVWIEPDLAHRIALVAAWTEPDYTSVNLSEDGSIELIRALLAVGIGVEAGVWTVADAELLVRSGLADRLTRVLVEPLGLSARDALAEVAGIHRVLDAAGIEKPRLQHGDGEATWPLISDAIARGLDTRVGFEDTLLLPDGRPARGNAELVAAARELGAGRP